MIYDVIVIGGGVIGAASADALVQAGQKVLLVEQFEPAHTRGSSHGDGRVVRFNYSEAIYVEMAQHAYPAWEALGKRNGKPLLQKTGLLEYGEDDNEAIFASQANLSLYDVPYSLLTVKEARQRYPQYRFEAGKTILYQADGAVAFASPTVLALWKLLKEGGASCLTQRRVEEIEIHAASVTVRDSTGESHQGRKLLITVGGWAQRILAQTGLPNLPLEASQECLAYFPSNNPQVNHRVGTMPMMIDYTPADPFYCLPQVDIAGVKVGWHHTGSVVDPDYPTTMPEHILAGMQDWIRTRFQHLDPQPIETVPCLYTNTPDYHFVLDTHPTYAHVVIGSGFSGHGFKFAPTLGEILARLILDREPLLDLSMFNLARLQHPETLHRRIGA